MSVVSSLASGYWTSRRDYVSLTGRFSGILDLITALHSLFPLIAHTSLTTPPTELLLNLQSSTTTIL